MCKKQVPCNVWVKCKFSSLFLHLRLFQPCCLAVLRTHLPGREPDPHTLHDFPFPDEAGHLSMCLFLITRLCVSLCPPLC